MKLPYLRLFLLLAVMLAFAGDTVAQKPAAKTTGNAKIQQFLKKSRYKVSKVDADIWTETKLAPLTQKDFDELIDQIFAVTDMTLQKLGPYIIKN